MNVEDNARWLDIDVRGHSLLAVTYRLARWDPKRGRYLELIVFGRHVL